MSVILSSIMDLSNSSENESNHLLHFIGKGCMQVYRVRQTYVIIKIFYSTFDSNMDFTTISKTDHFSPDCKILLWISTLSMT